LTPYIGRAAGHEKVKSTPFGAWQDDLNIKKSVLETKGMSFINIVHKYIQNRKTVYDVYYSRFPQ